MKTFPIFIVGFTGAGKTTYGSHLAKTLHVPFFDLDECVEAKEGKTIPEIFASEGEELFRIIESKVLESFLHTQAVISCGGGTACFHNNMERMNAHGHTIWIKASENTIFKNLVQSNLQHRPLIQGFTGEALKQWISATLEKRVPFYAQAKETVIAEELVK